MRRLAHETGESVNLGILSSTNIYYVQQVEGPNPLRFGRDVGLSVPLYCSALGKLLFAQVPMKIRSDIMKKLLLERRTKQTITDKVKLAKELNIILAKGYVVDLEENIENLVGIAVPVRDVHGAVVAGLSVMGPSMRMTAPQRNRLLPKLLAAADSLSVQLGWQNDRTRTAGDV